MPIVEKRYPSDFREYEETRTMISDPKIDMQLYTILQCYSMPYEIKGEDGHYYYETRVYKKDLPTQKKIAEAMGVSIATYKRKWAYLLNQSETNIYCPYIRQGKDKDGIYYVILPKEKYYVKIPLDICKHLRAGYSSLAVRIYHYLYARQQYLQNYLGGKNYIFTLMGLAKRLGISDNAQKYLWDYPDGLIPQALLTLQNNNLLTFERRRENNRNFYILTSITTDASKLPKLPVMSAFTAEEKRDKRLSEISDNADISAIPDIIDNGSPEYDKALHKLKAKEAMARLNAMTDVCLNE